MVEGSYGFWDGAGFGPEAIDEEFFPPPLGEWERRDD